MPIFNPDNPKEHHLKFTPMSDEEIKRAGLIASGTYDFEVVTAEEKTSKKGNPMIVVSLKVFVGGAERPMKDWLLEIFPKKFKHFLYGVGCSRMYDDGDLDPTALVGRTGKVVVGVEEQAGYNPKNVVEDYIVAGKEPEPKKQAAIPPVAVTDEPPF